MTALQLISVLGTKNIKLWLDDQGQLRFKGPKGAMDADLKAHIVDLKADLIRLLKNAQLEQPISIEHYHRTSDSQFPLSFAQQRFWFLDRLEPGNPALHIPAAVKIKGPLNLALFSQAFQYLLDRHESLRTYFISNDTHQTFQKIDPAVRWQIREDYDLSHLSEQKADKQVQQILKDEALKPFTLSKVKSGKPIFVRTKLIRLCNPCDNEQAFVFIINLHHIIADGWSMGLLIKELCYYYVNLINQTPSELPPLALHYIDYSQWQKQWMDSSDYQNQLAFWQNTLHDTPLLKLPTDYPRPDQAGFHGDSITLTINKELTKKLQGLKSDNGCTLFSLLLTAFHILLMRHSEQQDFAIGIPSSGRKQSQTHAIIGCFINILAIRASFDVADTFPSFLKRLYNTLLSAQDHQDIPFEAISETFSHHRSLSHHPLFQVLFSMQSDLLETNAMGDELLISQIPFRSVTAKYDLQLHIDELEHTLQATIEYNTDLFTQDHINDISRHFVNLLWSIVQKPNSLVIELDIYDEIDYQRFLPTQKAAHEPRKLLVEQCEKLSLKKPNNIAVSQGPNSITFEQLHTRSNALAAILVERGAKVNTRIAICLPPGIDSVVAILAVMKTAAAYIPMDTSYPKERLELIFKAAKPLSVISHSRYADNSIGYSPLFIDQLSLDCNTPIPEPVIDYHSAFYTIFTSGSTGTPKGVSVTQANAYNLIHWYKNTYNFNDKDRFLVISALGFDLTQKNLLLPLLLGAEIVFTETTTYDPKHISDTIYQKNISVLNCVPSAFYPVIDHNVRQDQMYSLSSLEHLLFGGEPINLDSLKPWINSPFFNAKVINMYGPTECTDISTTFTVDPIKQYFKQAIPIGQPIDGVSLYVLGQHQQLVPIGTAGELYIGGQGVAQGYLNQPELTDKSFIDDPFISKPGAKVYRTGDQVKFQRMPDGSLQLIFVGRLDDQIKIRGYRIEPSDIAGRLQQQDHIREALVVVDKNEENERLLAYYTSDKQAAIDLFQLRHYLKAYLPEYMIPQAFIEIEQWPLSANGKIDKNALPKPGSHHLVHNQYTAPNNLIEKQLCQLFSDKLIIEDVGTEDNFFELGGHSILATQLVGIIQNNFGVDLSVRTFFENPTIKAIASLIQEGSTLDDLQSDFPIIKVSRHSPLPLSPSQERLWIIEQMNPGQPTYLIPFAIRMQGELNKEAFKTALYALIERHETLRTGIRTNDEGIPYQHILSVDATPLHEIELASFTEALAYINQDAYKTFDWPKDSLCRITLIQLPDNDAILSVCIHHMVADGWSLGILQQELFSCYAACCDGQPLPLPSLNIQYADFSVWQRQYLQADRVQGHISFWVQQLQNAPDRLTLPTDYSRPAQQTFNGKQVNKSIDSDLKSHLAIFSQKQGISHYHTLLSTYFLLLQKYAHQNDICIGTPVAGRDRSELQSLIGYFVNTVIIRNDLSANPSFYELCQRTLDQCLGAFAHQDIPIEQVIDKLTLKRDLSYSPIAQVGFNLIDQALFQTPKLDNIDCNIIELNHVVSKYDLTLTVIDQDNGMQLQAEYNTDLFNDTTVEHLLNQFITLLSDCLTSPDKAINSFDIVSSDHLLTSQGIDTEQVTSIYPLNAMQHDMVLAQSILSTSRANTLGYRIDTQQPIDTALWCQSIQIVINNEPRLRTHFIINTLPYGEFAYQYEKHNLEADLTLLDFCNESLTAENLNKQVDAFIYQSNAYEKNLFFRYAVLKISKEHNVLLMSCHHAILDGISVAHVAKLTIDAYHALKNQPVVSQTQSVCAVNYNDYILKNRAFIDSQAVSSFWQQTLSTCEPLTFSHVSLDTSHQSDKHLVESLSLTSDEWQQLTQFCRRKKTTPALYLKMIYAILIANYCQADSDFYLTAFMAKRNNENQNDLGCFFQQMPFLVAIDYLKNNKSIDEFIEFFKHFQKRSKPYNSISKGLTQTLSPPGRIQFMFNFYHFLPETFEIEGLLSPCCETPPYVEGAVQFIVKAFKNTTKLELYYQPKLFNSLNFLARFKQLNQQIIQGESAINQLKLVLPHEFHSQRFEWQSPISHQDISEDTTTLTTLLKQQSEKTPDNIALIYKGIQLSYQSLHAQSNQMAHYLRELGVGTDIRVGVCLDLDIDAMIAILAIIKAGGAYVPIDTRHPTGRISHMLDSADIQLIICHKVFQSVNTWLDKTCIFIDDHTSEAMVSIQQQPTSFPDITTSLDDMLYVIFTSGSTGMPKGVAISHQGEINLQQWYCNTLQANTESRFIVISSLGFDLTQKNLFAPLITGGQLILSSDAHYDSHAIATTVNEHKATIINCAPSMLYPLVEDFNDFSHLHSLKHVILGGESIKLEKISPWVDSDCFGAQITNHYGPTECTDIASYYNVDDIDQFLHKTPPIGRPNTNVNIYIINQQKQLLPTGLMGEIAIAGKGVGLGYLNHDDLNHERFIANPFDEGQMYLTGDLGQWSNHGQLEFIARKDFQLKINGQRVEPGEIEHSLLHQAGVTDALITILNNQLVAYVVCEKDYIDREYWPIDLANYLPRYMIPQHFVLLDEWPLNANGKIDRQALPPITTPMQKRPYCAPRNTIEETIANIIAHTLNIEKVSILDNFFDIGANSLSASRAMVQIREHYHIDIPLNLLFELTTTEKLAAYIKATQWASNNKIQSNEKRDTGVI